MKLRNFEKRKKFLLKKRMSEERGFFFLQIFSSLDM